MTGGCVNVRLGRRGRFNKCFYYKRNVKIRDLSEYKLKETKYGPFFAKIEAVRENSKEIVDDNFMFDRDKITISTNDSVNIVAEDIVEFQEQMWRVGEVQYKHIVKQSKFKKEEDKITYLTLRK